MSSRSLCYKCAVLLGCTGTSRSVPCDGCGNPCDGSLDPVRSEAPKYVHSQVVSATPSSTSTTSAREVADSTWRSSYRPAPIVVPYVPVPTPPSQWPIQQWDTLFKASARISPGRGVIKSRSSRPAPPKRITLLHVDGPAIDSFPPPITYQTLALLLNDLNRLLLTPHEGREFAFRGRCAVIVGAADTSEDALKTRVLWVAWEIIERTVLSFDVQNLAVHGSAYGAVGKTRSIAIWMGALPDPRLQKEEDECPCARCEHLLTMSVSLEPRNRVEGVWRVSVWF
ncbi:hypothetical protein B0H14DRAFT_3143467 [Mycena olivaceomarginata]|nr:hypothetical protein B0H14DRAFT_3143467 [Mycena olivaceomarginata]